MINPAALIGSIIGFFIGTYLTRSLLIGLLFGMLGSSIGSRLGTRRGGESARDSGSFSWFSGWGGAGANAGPVFMETLFSMLGRLAAADGEVSAEEEQLFRQVVANELHITDPASSASALAIFRRAAQGNKAMGDYARQAALSFRTRPQLLEMMLVIMVRVSAAKGRLHIEEDRLMREAAAIFGFPGGVYESLKRRYGLGASSGRTGAGAAGASAKTGTTLQAAYDVLGVGSNDSETDIRKAYRKKASEYHPDKIAAKGLPTEFTELANQKFREVQQSWEHIRQARGF